MAPHAWPDKRLERMENLLKELEGRIKKLEKKEPNEQGICPKCKITLEYDGYQMKDDSLCYGVWCPNKECNWRGTEWYSTEYDNTADITGMPL